MLDYLKERTGKEGAFIETFEADMTSFSLGKKADFAFIMMGTIGLIESRERFLCHLDSVAGSLRSGGLYLIENMKLDWASDGFFGSQC